MEFRVLGPLELRHGGVAVPIGSRKQQCVLAALAVNAGQVVELSELVDELWPDNPPASAAANARGYAANLRRILISKEPHTDRLVRRGSGYVLHVAAEELDLLAFSTTVSAGREALRQRDLKIAAARLGEALALWRGPLVAGLPRGPLLTARAAAAEGDRLAAVEALAEVRLDLDEPDETVALLRPHVRQHPLRERGHLVLMRALYRLGDVSGALAVYTAARTALAEQLGIEPGQDLQELHQAVLRRRPPASLTSTSTDDAPARRRALAQLPLDVFGFSGRRDHLHDLDRILEAAGEQPTAVVISAVSGTAGVGKTATAVHWAHRVREEFPDGQLYVNLRGFDPSGTPMEPGEAIRIFLDALGVPPQQVPADLDALSGLYRSLLSGRRILVLLDNARDSDQVRPLLPGAAGCVVLVTSRNRLTGLIAAEGAHSVTLDVLPPDEARQLLVRRLGAERVAAEPEAVERVIAACARLPLALTIAAARAATRPQLPLTAVAAELDNARDRLNALDGGDPVVDVRAVFASSYRALTPPAARLFRLLGLHPGPDISATAAASLAAVPVAEARRLLNELTRAHLLSEYAGGRYASHDLLRVYAAELAGTDETDTDRDAAVRRILDHYLHAAYAAALHLHPNRDSVTLNPPTPAVTLENFVDADHATAWFKAEHGVLLSVVRLAVNAGFDTHTARLAWAMSDFLQREGRWSDQIAVQGAATLSADRIGRAHAHRALARIYARGGRLDEALAEYRNALALLEELGDRTGQSMTQAGLAWVYGMQGRREKAISHGHRAIELSATVENQMVQGNALNVVGWNYALFGEYEKALPYCEQARELQQELGDVGNLGATWDSLGHIHHGLGDYQRAVSCLQQALELTVGDRLYVAQAVDRLGDAYHAMGDRDSAQRSWQQALKDLEELGHPDAGKVRAKLTAG